MCVLRGQQKTLLSAGSWSSQAETKAKRASCSCNRSWSLHKLNRQWEVRLQHWASNVPVVLSVERHDWKRRPTTHFGYKHDPTPPVYKLYQHHNKSIFFLAYLGCMSWMESCMGVKETKKQRDTFLQVAEHPPSIIYPTDLAHYSTHQTIQYSSSHTHCHHHIELTLLIISCSLILITDNQMIWDWDQSGQIG